MSTPRSPAARQADIARLAGVSQSTVSLVLSGAGDVSRVNPATYARVLKAAAELGYEGAMATKPRRRRLQLGVHTFERVFPTRASDYYSTFLTAIEEQAAAEGCNLLLFTALHGPGDGGIYRDGRNELRHASGSILLGRRTDDDDLARLVKENYPFVFIGEREVRGEPVNYVGADYRSTTGQITADLLALGHTTIAYLGEPRRTSQQRQRWEGFREALVRFGVQPPEPHYLAPEEVSAEWLLAQRAAGATALLVEAATQLKVVETLAAIAGIGIPSELSVVLLVDLPEEAAAERDWGQLKVPRAAMGAESVRLLVTTIRDPAGEYERQLLLPCDYSLGSTAAPPPLTPRR